MDLSDFIAIMRKWYGDTFNLHIDQNNNNNDNRRPIILSAPGASAFPSITIMATNDILAREDIGKVQYWLVDYYNKVDKSLKWDGMVMLGSAIIVWDYTNTGSLPEGYTVVVEDSGARTLFDKDGQNIGSLSADASPDDKTALVLTALAEEISEEWVANPPDNADDLVLPDNAMETTARISESDIAAVTADLIAMPGMGPLSNAPMDDLTADRLRGLFVDVSLTLANKNFVSKNLIGIPATTIDDICKNNGFQFQYDNADGNNWRGGYQILKENGEAIAGGELKKIGMGSFSQYYLTNPKGLENQLRDAKVREAVRNAIPPEQTSRATRQEARIKNFFTERKKGPDKPGKDPDPDKEDPHGNGQDGPGN